MEHNKDRSLAVFALSLMLIFVWGISFADASSSGESEYSKDRLFIRVRNNLLDIKVRAVPLDEVLKEISRKTRVKIVVTGSLRDKVTFKSRKIPLDKVLNELIEGSADYMFAYQQPSVLREVWIFSKDTGAETGSGSSHSQQEGTRARNRLAENVKDTESTDILLTTPVENLLKSHDAEIRIKAVEILAESQDVRAVELLTSALNDEDEDVRESTVLALARIRDSRALEPIIEHLRDDDEWVRASAADALAIMGDQIALPYLIEALDNEGDTDARESLQEAIDKLTQ